MIASTERSFLSLLLHPNKGGMRAMKCITALLLLLCGCASDMVLPPPQVANTDFSVTSLPNKVFLIAYKGPSQSPRPRILDLALLKASQLARQRELDYFVIIDQAASRPGETKYLSRLPEPAEFNNELMIQAFKGRPERIFSFRSEATEKAIYEKLRTAEDSETL